MNLKRMFITALAVLGVALGADGAGAGADAGQEAQHPVHHG